MTQHNHPPDGKMEFDEWKEHYQDEIIDRFLEDYEEKIKNMNKAYLASLSNLCGATFDIEYAIKNLYEESRDAQYAEYLDTPEFDHMKEGCSFSKGER
jgi:hypothetical protein